jgi:hypothetical protein
MTANGRSSHPQDDRNQPTADIRPQASNAYMWPVSADGPLLMTAARRT